jgi:hypothetical protein
MGTMGGSKKIGSSLADGSALAFDQYGVSWKREEREREREKRRSEERRSDEKGREREESVCAPP